MQPGSKAWLRLCPLQLAQQHASESQQAAAQVRQHVEHKRTFFYLEQLILKHNADAHCLNIKEIHEVCQLSSAAAAPCCSSGLL